MKTKKELLEHYSEKKPTEFIQFDFFADQEDSFLGSDEEGFSICRSETTELMNGYYKVRVLVKPDLEGELVIKGLEKLIAWIKKDPIFLKNHMSDIYQCPD